MGATLGIADATELDMITPLYWNFRDPDIGLDEKWLLPFFYSHESPRESSIALLPFFGHFKRYGLSETTWVTPLFRHETHSRGWSTNLYPFLYTGEYGKSSHTVLAPLFWDYASPGSRTTIAFPLYWRFAERDVLSQLTGNVYYRERRVKGGSDWEVHILPLFSYGQSPRGHFWNVLFGLAGYSREGKEAELRTLWIPFDVGD